MLLQLVQLGGTARGFRRPEIVKFLSILKHFNRLIERIQLLTNRLKTVAEKPPVRTHSEAFIIYICYI